MYRYRVIGSNNHKLATSFLSFPSSSSSSSTFQCTYTKEKIIIKTIQFAGNFLNPCRRCIVDCYRIQAFPSSRMAHSKSLVWCDCFRLCFVCKKKNRIERIGFDVKMIGTWWPMVMLRWFAVLTQPLRGLECVISNWLIGRIFCCSRRMDRRTVGRPYEFSHVFCTTKKKAEKKKFDQNFTSTDFLMHGAYLKLKSNEKRLPQPSKVH